MKPERKSLSDKKLDLFGLRMVEYLGGGRLKAGTSMELQGELSST